MTANPTPKTITFCPNGQVACFDFEDRQIPHLQQEDWLSLWLKNLENKGINPLDVEDVYIQVGSNWERVKLKKCPDGEWTYTLLSKIDLKVGDRVTYEDHDNFKNEKGIVKSLDGDSNMVFVVYKCGEDWDNYQNYTASKTLIKDLFMGWL